MDDFFEFLLFFLIVPALVFVFIFSLIGLAKDADQDDKREDSRYELCLKQHKDWVDGDCVTPVK